MHLSRGRFLFFFNALRKSVLRKKSQAVPQAHATVSTVGSTEGTRVGGSSAAWAGSIPSHPVPSHRPQGGPPAAVTHLYRVLPTSASPPERSVFPAAMASVPSAGCLLAKNQYYRSKCSGGCGAAPRSPGLGDAPGAERHPSCCRRRKLGIVSGDFWMSWRQEGVFAVVFFLTCSESFFFFFSPLSRTPWSTTTEGIRSAAKEEVGCHQVIAPLGHRHFLPFVSSRSLLLYEELKAKKNGHRICPNIGKLFDD